MFLYFRSGLVCTGCAAERLPSFAPRPQASLLLLESFFSPLLQVSAQFEKSSLLRRAEETHVLDSFPQICIRNTFSVPTEVVLSFSSRVPALGVSQAEVSEPLAVLSDLGCKLERKQ